MIRRGVWLMVMAGSWGAVAADPPTVGEARVFVERARGELLERWIEAERATWVQGTCINEDTQLLAAAAQARMIETTVRLAQEAARFEGPLDECSICGNAEAGRRLGEMPEMGSGRPWQDALEALTGQPAVDATAMLDHFAPLIDWLEEQNAGRTCGW